MARQNHRDLEYGSQYRGEQDSARVDHVREGKEVGAMASITTRTRARMCWPPVGLSSSYAAPRQRPLLGRRQSEAASRGAQPEVRMMRVIWRVIGRAPLSLAALFLFAAAGPVSAQTPRDSTIVILLGTGTPRPDPAAQGPATAVVVGSRVFLFDAGAGVMRQVSAAKLAIDGPTALFITHLHSDHTLG